jgi:hypothetical protein
MASGSLYLYVRIDAPEYAARAPLDLYVTVEVVDDSFNRVALQYDRQVAAPNIGTCYTHSAQSVLCLAQGGIRKLFFHLPAHRVGHGQNQHTDFRLCAAGLAVRRIEVSPRQPDGFSAEAGLDPASLAALRTERAPGMELTLGNDASAADAALFRALSVSSVESYVHWAGVEPDVEGTWDWRQWDEQVRILQANGLKWVPFLIAGPAYATPLWFQNSPESHVYVCLEHDQPSRVQSLFNPALPARVERFLRAFAERYRDTGVIESVLLGITGIYGESIYPAGPESGWTAGLTGDYHNHTGWWAGDSHAQAAFREAMRRQYRRVGRLNQAWGTAFADFAEVRTFLPDRAPSDRARADFVEWYQQAMTDWSVFWVKATRRAFPRTPIYLCTGGDGHPVLGADFTAQTKAIRRTGAGVRITNEASDYAANFTVTREVASATRLYGTFAGFEPAGEVTPLGVAARLYNATASGARQLHYYHPNILNSGEALRRFRENARYLLPRQPRVTAALYVPRETWAIEPATMAGFYAHARALRDVVDYEMLTRLSVADGGLRDVRLLVLVECPVLEPEAAAALTTWVRRGGILVAAPGEGQGLGTRLYDLAAWRRELFPEGASTAGLLAPALVGAAPPSWALHLGTEKDAGWLFGDWYHREQGLEWPALKDARKRWSGRRPGIWLPTVPGAAYTLTIEANLSGHSLKGDPNTVSVNGTPVGRLDRDGPQRYQFQVPAEVVGGGPLARMEVAMSTWSPKAVGQSGDARDLGVALHRLDWCRAGAEGAPLGEARIEFRLAPKALANCARQVRRGWSVLLPGLGSRPQELQSVLSALVRNTPELLPGTAPLAGVDGLADGHFATETADGILWYDAASGAVRLEADAGKR